MARKHSVIVADFDGVFVRMSEFFKRDAWPEVFFGTYGDLYIPHYERAVKEYEQSRTGDRFTILRSTFKGLNEPEDKIDALVVEGARAFDEIVQGKILSAGVDPSVKIAFEEILSIVPVYLNSATPLEALKRTVTSLGIEHLFKDVLGRPHSKAENLHLVAEREAVGPEEVLFIGDSESDAVASSEFGCDFVGWANEWNGWLQDTKSFPVISDMLELKRYI